MKFSFRKIFQKVNRTVDDPNIKEWIHSIRYKSEKKKKKDL